MKVSIPRSRRVSETQELIELRRARDQYQAAFEEAFDVAYILNDEARVIEANAEAADLYGLQPGSLCGRSIAEFLPHG